MNYPRAVFLIILSGLLAYPISVAPVHAKPTPVCTNSMKESVSPAPHIAAFAFVAACGYTTTGVAGFTSSFNNMTTWTNSTSIQAGTIDFYFEGVSYPCNTPQACKDIYLVEPKIKPGTFINDGRSFGPFSASKSMQCVLTAMISFNIVYNGVSYAFPSISAEQDYSHGCL